MSNSKEYKKYVELGKDLVSKIEVYQVKIAEYADKVCTIRHGGRSPGIYTIKRYAQDIGLPPKTVQNWVAAYRNVAKKLDVKITTEKQWKHVRKTNDILSELTTIANKKEGTISKNRTINTPVKKVRELYKTIESEEKPFVVEVKRLTQSAKHAKHLLIKRDLNIVDDEMLLHLMNLLDDASELINEHLTKKQKIKKSA